MDRLALISAFLGRQNSASSCQTVSQGARSEARSECRESTQSASLTSSFKGYGWLREHTPRWPSLPVRGAQPCPRASSQKASRSGGGVGVAACLACKDRLAEPAPVGRVGPLLVGSVTGAHVLHFRWGRWRRRWWRHGRHWRRLKFRHGWRGRRTAAPAEVAAGHEVKVGRVIVSHICGRVCRWKRKTAVRRFSPMRREEDKTACGSKDF